MPLPPGTRLGPYEIVAPLGSGGMGEVYRARDSRLGRDVAVKVLPQDVSSQADRLARFEREAKTVAALNHPNIVTLHSIEESGGLRFLTMELVEGQGLDRLVTPGGLPLARVLELAIPLADALAAAHERGVVHRDLKPANVMVTREGRVKVLDFGLAKLAAAEVPLDATQALTMEAPVSTVGQVMGTVPYMAPEQVRGETIDARTDLFAYGILLYELLSGRRPFGGTTSADVSSSILRDTPEPLATLRADLPGDVGRIVSRCLEKDPRDRLQTALDVCNELRLVKRALESTATTPRGAAAAAGREAPSIAVLPFVNRSRDEEDEYFADGLADELLNVLAKIRGLRVAARTSSFSFKGKDVTIAEVGRALQVATVLEGSVRKAGSRVRISVQLVKVSDGFHLWSETYDRTLDDIFAVQDDIAQSVVKELRATLLGGEPDSKVSGEVRAEVAAAAKGRGSDAEAHRLFLQGRFLVNRLTGADMLAGIAHLRRALELDPTHALAWACLSWAATIASNTGAEEVEAMVPLARMASSRALALVPDLAEGHLALAMTRHWHDFDWSGARAAYSRAMELAPESAEVARGIGSLEYCLANFDAAVRHCRRATEIDPLAVVGYGFIGRVYRAAGRYDEAIEAFRRGIELSPDVTSAHGLIAIALDQAGRGDEALAEALLEPASWARLYALSVIHYRAGRIAESNAALRELTETCASHSAYQIAGVHAFRGDADAAFEWLDRAHAQHDSGVAVSRSDPFFLGLHGDPRWTAFLSRMGFAGA